MRRRIALAALLSCASALVHVSGMGQEPTGGRTFFLPQNPVAAAYVLGRLSNAELIAAPRSEFVYVALLERKGMEKKYRLEALEGLCKIRHTSAPAELLNALVRLDKKGEESESTLRDLAATLLQRPAIELAASRESLSQLALSSQLPVSRQIGYAACASADAAPDKVWEEVKGQPTRMVDVILSVPVIPSAALRSEFYLKVQPLVTKGETPELRRAAMQTLVSIPGHDAQTFESLAESLQAGTEKDAAVAGLARLPKAAWSPAQIPTVTTNLVEYLESVPTAERATAGFTEALQLAAEMASAVPEPLRQSLQQRLRGLGPTVVVLHAIYEQMRFDQQLIVVEKSRPVVIAFQNDDAMPHNLAILSPGALEEIGLAAEKMPAEPDDQGRLYVPSSAKVLCATKLIGPGQKGQLAFTAPAEPGDYPFVCTFPGHWRRMTGILAVTEDPAAYLATHTQAPPKLTEWKLADLASELSRATTQGDALSGKEFFSKLACVQCHRLGDQGYAFGPDISDVFKRYQNDRTAVLQQILEPSAKIDERYRNYNFELKDGDSVVGVVLKEDAETVTVQTGPADSLIQVLKKSEILQKRPLGSSPMPVGLLNSLSSAQIFDLLAYLQSGGKLAAHAHPH